MADFVPDRRRRRGDAAAPPPARSAWARPTPRSSACPATPRTTWRRRPARPWDRTRLAGGSSGGAAVAVAAGLVAVRAGQRRRRLDPHPGQRLRAVRDQAHPRPGQQRPASAARSTGLGTQRPAGPDGARRGGDARRDGRPGAGRPGLGAAAAGRRDVPRLVRPGAPGRLRIGRFREPAVAGAELRAGGARPRSRTPRGCWPASATRSRTSTAPLPPEVMPSFETVWARVGARRCRCRRTGSASCGR